MTATSTMQVLLDASVSRLVQRCAATLERAEMHEALAMLTARLIQHPSRLIAIRRDADCGCTAVAELRPYAELLFYEVQDIAQRKLDVATRTLLVDRALSLGGV